MKILGLLGPAGSGKSTAAKYLAEKYTCMRYSFADPLKHVAMRTLGFTYEQCYGTQAQKEAVDPRYGFSPRWFLQKLGTEGCRGVFGDSFWTERTLDLIVRQQQAAGAHVAVIEDVRFVNEANAIHAVGGAVWRLECPDRESVADATHASEAEWSRCGYDRLISARLSPGSVELLREVDAAFASPGWRTAYEVLR